MANEALLELSSPVSNTREIVKVVWDRNYDDGARVIVPKSISREWNTISQDINSRYQPGAVMTPYPGLPYTIDARQLNTSASGAYVIAYLLSNGRTRWLTPPPYPKPPIFHIDPDTLPGIADDDIEIRSPLRLKPQ